MPIHKFLAFGQQDFCHSVKPGFVVRAHTQVFGVRSTRFLSFGQTWVCRSGPYTSFWRSVNKISVIRSNLGLSFVPIHKFLAFGQQDFCRSVAPGVVVRALKVLAFGQQDVCRSVTQVSIVRSVCALEKFLCTTPAAFMELVQLREFQKLVDKGN